MINSSINNLLIVEDELYNSIKAYGSGSGINRAFVNLRDTNSIAKYGLRETIVEFSDAITFQELSTAAADFLDKHKEPVTEIDIDYYFDADKGPGGDVTRGPVFAPGGQEVNFYRFNEDRQLRRGDRIRIVSQELGINTIGTVEELTWEPGSVNINIGKKYYNLISLIKDPEAEDRRLIDRLGPPPPLGLKASSAEPGILVTLNPYFEGRAVGVEIYIGGQENFVADRSSLIARGSSARFEFKDLKVGDRFYFRARAYDSNGNYSELTDEVSAVSGAFPGGKIEDGTIDLPSFADGNRPIVIVTDLPVVQPGDTNYEIGMLITFLGDLYRLVSKTGNPGNDWVRAVGAGSIQDESIEWEKFVGDASPIGLVTGQLPTVSPGSTKYRIGALINFEGVLYRLVSITGNPSVDWVPAVSGASIEIDSIQPDRISSGATAVWNKAQEVDQMLVDIGENFSQITQTDNKVETVVAALGGYDDQQQTSFSAVTQTANEISSVVATLGLDADDPGQYSSIKQTASEITSVVGTLNGPADAQGQYTAIKQTFDEIGFQVNAFDQNLQENIISSYINLSTEGVKIGGDKITLSGDTTVDGSFQVSGNAIIGGTLDAGAINTNTVTANTALIASISAGVLQAGAIKSDMIEAGAVRADRLSVRAADLVGAVTKNQNINGWGGVDEIGVGTPPQGVSYNSGQRALQLANSGNLWVRSDTFAVDHSKIYRVDLRLRSNLTGGLYYVGISGFTQQTAGSGSISDQPVTQNVIPYNTSRQQQAQVNDFYFNSGNKPTTYTRHTYYIIGANRNVNEAPNWVGPVESGTRPFVKLNDTTTHVAIRFLNWANASVTRSMLIRDVSVTDVSTGTIVADNIEANAITADKITSGAITTAKLSVGNVIIDDAGQPNAGAANRVRVVNASNQDQVVLGKITNLGGVPTGVDYGLWGTLGSGVYIQGVPRVIAVGGSYNTFSLAPVVGFWPSGSAGAFKTLSAPFPIYRDIISSISPSGTPLFTLQSPLVVPSSKAVVPFVSISRLPIRTSDSEEENKIIANVRYFVTARNVATGALETIFNGASYYDFKLDVGITAYYPSALGAEDIRESSIEFRILFIEVDA